MDIVIGSGNNRQKVTFASGRAIRELEKSDPIGYVKAKGAILGRIRSNK